MRAEVITIGDEILIGQTIDTNSAWLGNELNMIGVDIIQITSIPDTNARIKTALDDAFQRAELILLTGGLGPTQDDITKSTLAEYFDTKLVSNSKVLDRIKTFAKARGIELLPAHVRQAELPENAEVIDNHHGSASGMWFKKNGTNVISMPGVPYEMKAMMKNTVIPYLAANYKDSEIIHHTVLTQGVGESQLAKTLKDWEKRLRQAGLSLAYLPSAGAVKLRITSKDLKDGRQLVKTFAAELDQLIDKHIFGYNNDTLPQVVGTILKTLNKTVGTAESCTGGYIAHQITSISGSSEYFNGSIIAYSNNIKVNQLDVSETAIEEHGAVSEIVVRQMAEGARKALNTDYAIATSGVAGPTGGTDEKPVGTVWIAVSGPEETKAVKFKFGNNRQRNIHVAGLTGMNMLRRMLK